MDLEKRYQDENGNQRNILEMVRRFPEWAANRIQDGERSDDRIAELEEQLYEMTPERDSESRWAKEYHDRVKELEAQLAAMTSERDSESRWAKEYHDRAKELEAQLAEMKAAQKLAVDNWTIEAQNLKVAENKLTSMVLWLERYQPDVFQRGLWDALNA